MKLRKTLYACTAFFLCLCLASPVCFATSGNFETLFAVSAESGFSFIPFDSTGVISGTTENISDSDMYFGLGNSYYTLSMSKGYANGMTMEAVQKTASLQDATGGANYTAEVSFDMAVDASASNPLQFRFFPQDKGGTVHKGNSIAKSALTPKADGTRLLTVYDRTGKTVLGEVNLTDVLGSYISADGYFFRFRYIFQATDDDGNVLRNIKVYVDGKKVIDATYANNSKEYRIAGIGIQRACASYGAIDNFEISQYNGVRKTTDGNDAICDDKLVAAIRKAAILKNGAENAYLNELNNAVQVAKMGYLTMQPQTDCDTLSENLEKAIKTYSDSVTMESFVFSDFTKENALYITQDMTFPTGFLPAYGGIYDCSVTADKNYVVSANGVVTRPKYNETVLLTANLTRDTDFSSMRKTFSIRVLADGTVTKTGNVTSGYTKKFASANRVLFGGYTDDASAEIAFGVNKATVSENSEFSVVCDYISKEFILYQNGEIVLKDALRDTPSSVSVSGTVSESVLILSNGYGYTVDGLQFETAEGSPRTIPVENGKVSGAKLICKDDALKDTDVYAAVYENKKLFSVTRAEISEKHNYNEVFTVPFTVSLPKESENVTIKLLFIKDREAFSPIVPEYQYVAKEHIKHHPTIYIAGDSSACNYSAGHFPQTGWGQVIGNYFPGGVTVTNLAAGGRSAKSFMDEGRLDTIFSQIQPGDYLLVQFGGNDQKIYTDEPYRDYLKVYVNGARELGATPIILTSGTRRIYKDGVFDQGANLGKFPQAARDVAAEMNVPLIDAFDFTVNLINTLGEEGSKDIYLHLVKNDPRFIGDSRFTNSRYNQQDVTADNSHYQQYGAEVIAGFIAEELNKLNLSLSAYYTPYTPIKP